MIISLVMIILNIESGDIWLWWERGRVSCDQW